MFTIIMTPLVKQLISCTFLPRSWSEFQFWGQSGTAWLGAGLLILAGFLMRKPSAYVFSKLVSWIRWRGRPVGRQAGDLLGPIIAWTIPLICGYFALLKILRPSPVLASVLSRILEIGSIIIILLIVDVIIQGLFFIIGHAEKRLITPTIKRFYLQIIRVFLFILGLIMIFSLFGLNVGGIITGLGVGGLAVSLAAKDTLTNLLAGIVIMTDRLFEIGDLIRTSEIEGTVEYIGFRTSRIRDYDQSLIYVPNAKFTENYVYNLTHMAKRRIRLIINLPITINYEQTREIQQLLQTEIEQRSDLTDDAVVTVLDAIEVNTVQLLVQYYLTNLDYARLREEKDFLLGKVWQYLDSYQLQIPETFIHFVKED